MFYKPSKQEQVIIQDCAKEQAKIHGGTRSIYLEPGMRYNVDDTISVKSFNILKVTSHPTWDDTDLYEFGHWVDFTKGFELTEDNQALFDFYIYDKRNHSLICNIQAEFDATGLCAVHADIETIWTR